MSIEFIASLKAAIRVSTPLVAVNTFDASVTIEHIRKEIPSLEDSPLVLWDTVFGFRPLNDAAKAEIPSMADKAGTDVMASAVPEEAVRMAFYASNDVVILFSNYQLFMNTPAMIQGVWNLRNGYKMRGNMFVALMASGTTIPAVLTNDVLVLSEALPTEKQLEAIIKDTFENASLPEPDSKIIKKAVDALIGLPVFPSDQTSAMCLNVKHGTLDTQEMWERKRQTINQQQGLTVWQGSERMEDIGGLDNVKSFIHKLMNGRKTPKVVIFIDEIEKAFAGTGTDTSGTKTELTGQMLSWTQDKNIGGIMFLGVPGVAKSQIAKCMWSEYGVCVISFDLSAMQGSLVGQSIANLKAAIETVNAISGGDILMIATSNNIEALPGELKDRFQLGTFFFDNPNQTERDAIWSIHRKAFDIPAEDVTPNSEGWNGRAIKEACSKAWRLNISLEEAAYYTVPLSVSNRERMEALKMNSSGKYLSASHKGIYTYSPNSEQTAIVSETGRRIRN